MTKPSFAVTLIRLATPAPDDFDGKFRPDGPRKAHDLAITGSKATPVVKGPIFEPYLATPIEETEFYMLLAASDGTQTFTLRGTNFGAMT